MTAKQNVNKDRRASNTSSYNEEYGYDFVPSLNQWVNIDEQNEITKRLEDIDKK